MEDNTVATFILIFNQSGELPVWHLMSNVETYTMVGSPGIPVLADALLKGYVLMLILRTYQAINNEVL